MYYQLGYLDTSVPGNVTYVSYHNNGMLLHIFYGG